MLLGMLIFLVLIRIDAASMSAASGTSCSTEPPDIGSLLQREFSELTGSRGAASDLLYLSSVGMDLGANLAPKPWELLELNMEDVSLSVNFSESQAAEMEKSFKFMSQKMHLQSQYTTAELTTFKDNFVNAIAHDTQVEEKKLGNRKLSKMELQNLMKREMFLQQPVTTEKLAKDINRRKLGWVAGVSSEVAHLTLQDFDNELGYRKESDAPVDPRPPKSEEVAFIGQEAMDPPENFDVRAGWPECEQIVGLVPNQGRCASCWALTTVGVFNDRLCIVSGGVFKSQLSAADILACSKKNYGCKGGNPAWAVQFLKDTGTVTGSGYTDRGIGKTCFPYPVRNIDATKHFESQVLTPECRDFCPELLYPRGYKKDKYVVSGNAYLVGTKYPHESAAKTRDTWESLKRVMSTKGSVMMMYAVGRSHVAYESGFWDCPAGQPNHMARCIGYGVDPEHGKYITCVQSWGTSWGEEGRFRMKFPGNGCLEMLMSIPVGWVGKNERTGVPPSFTKSVWQSFWDFLGWKSLR